MRGQQPQNGDQIGILTLQCWKRFPCMSYNSISIPPHYIAAVLEDSLSGSLVSAEGGLVDVGGGSLWVGSLLGDQSNSSLVALSWENSDSL